MIEPHPYANRTGEIANHILFRSLSPAFLDGDGSREEKRFDIQGHGQQGGAHNPVKVVVGNDSCKGNLRSQISDLKEKQWLVISDS
jgi:hypothetical protein